MEWETVYEKLKMIHKLAQKRLVVTEQALLFRNAYNVVGDCFCTKQDCDIHLIDLVAKHRGKILNDTPVSTNTFLRGRTCFHYVLVTKSR